MSKDELFHESLAPTVRVLWRHAGITETPLEPSSEKFAEIHEKSFDVPLPTIFIAAALIAQDPRLVALALNLLADWVAEWFRGIMAADTKAKLSIVLETKQGLYKKITYEGPAEGMRDLPQIVEEVYHE